MIRPKQINLRELFPVKDVLKARGFDVSSTGDGLDLLIPIPPFPYTNCDVLFEAFDDQNSRSQILESIKNSNFYVTNPSALTLIRRSDFIPERQRYSTSFEWYIGELMVRKFSSFSAAYGVKIRDVYRNSDISSVTGDYDVIAVTRDVNIIYFECKTGSFNTDKIKKCIERTLALHAEFSAIVVENLNLNSLKGCLKGLSHPLMNTTFFHELQIKGNLESKVYEWNNCFFLEAAGNIEDQLRILMRINGAKKVGHNYAYGFDDETYDKIGYVKTSVQL